jgi:hypothetical protein
LLGSFAQLGQLGILAPAVFTAAGISIGVLIAAFKDMKKVLGDLGPSFHQLQDVISARFWNQAAQPIRHMVNTLMPALKASLGGVAEAWGNLFGKMAREIEANVTPEELSFMMGNLRRAIDIASNAMKPLVHAFNTLGSFGSTYLPRLSAWLVDISKKFDAFITKADKEGKLKEWAEEGIKTVKDLGKVIYETGRVFSALNMAAQRAGGSNFETLAGGLKKLSDLMRTEGFQKGFETIFAGAHLLMDGLLDGLRRLGPGLAIFAVTFNTVASTMGKILGALGDDISALFMDPTLNQGLKNFFSGFLTFIADLKPAMAPLGQIIGTLGSALGVLLSQAGPIIAALAQELAPAFVSVWESIKPLIPDLTNLATTIIKELGPPLTTLVKEVLPPLIPIIAALVPLVAAMVKAASPVLVVFFQQLGDALEKAGPHIRNAAVWITDLVKAMDGFPKAFAQISLGDKPGGFSTIIQIAIDHPEIPAFFTALGTAMGGLWEKLQLLGTVIGTITTLANPTTGIPAIAVAISTFTNAVDILFGISDRWNGFWTGLQTILTTVTSMMPPQLQGVLIILTGAFTLFFTIRGQWDGFWNGLSAPVALALAVVTGNVRTGLTNILLAVATWVIQTTAKWNTTWQTLLVRAVTGMAQIAGGIAGGFPNIVMRIAIGVAQMLASWSSGFSNILAGAVMWMSRIFSGVNQGIPPIVAIFGGLPGRMIATVTGWYQSFVNAGASLVGGFAKGITSGVNAAVQAALAVVSAVAGALPHSPAKYGPFSGTGWTPYRGKALIDGFAEGMRSRTAALKKQSIESMGVVAANGMTFSRASVPSASTYTDTSRSGALVHIDGDYYGATPEKVAAEFDTKLRRANLVAQLGKVGK